MKIITVMETAYAPHSLYTKANTKATRALVGFMVRTGHIDNTIMGGALSLLCDIEAAVKANHVYQLYMETKHGNEIVSIVDMARNGKFAKFTMSKMEINKNKNLVRR